MTRYIRVFFFFIKLLGAYVLAFFIKCFNPQMRNIWIISERGDDARDNGWFFFKYMVENHPEQPIYYVITSVSADAPKVRAIGKTVETNSFRHFVYYALSTVRISSSMWGGDLPYTDYFNKIRKYMWKKRKFVFLKHGIIKDYLPQHCSAAGNPDLYICGAKPEYDFVLERFGHGKQVIQYTGLARFDNLHSVETKRQILFMPTFRKWLQGKPEHIVAESEYIQAWNNVIEDLRLIETLERNHLELIFYPHYVMQKYVDLFHSKSSLVKIAKFKDYDVQTLLIESKLLVTDFSSVFFDFGYMKKPTVYYQFDREQYIKGHYDFTRGYFNYDRDGFGEVAFDPEQLVQAVVSTIDRDFALEESYAERIGRFFPLHDQNNCDRIHEKIMERLAE